MVPRDSGGQPTLHSSDCRSKDEQRSKGGEREDKDRNDKGTTTILLDAGFLVSDKFHGQSMFDFLF